MLSHASQLIRQSSRFLQRLLAKALLGENEYYAGAQQADCLHIGSMYESIQGKRIPSFRFSTIIASF